MGEAVAMLDWIKNRVVDKSKFESMDFEERKDNPQQVFYMKIARSQNIVMLMKKCVVQPKKKNG